MTKGVWAMAYRPSSMLSRYSPQRRAIYSHLLKDRSREWTVATLTASLRRSASSESVRTTLYVLIADGLMIQVPGHHDITARLTTDGADALKRLVDVWPGDQVNPPAVNPDPPASHLRASTPCQTNHSAARPPDGRTG